MAYIGIKNGTATTLGDVPQDVLADQEFRAQFDEIRLDATEARRLCAAHIERHYPTYKQLNLLRSGSQAEKDRMDVFINACRDWSNGENHDPAVLEAIQP